MAERGRIYLWPRNRSFGDGKPRPVVVIAPDAATRLTPADLAAIAAAMIQALDLRCLEPWQAVEDIS